MTTFFESLFSSFLGNAYAFQKYDEDGYLLEDNYFDDESDIDEDLDDGFEDDELDDGEWE